MGDPLAALLALAAMAVASGGGRLLLRSLNVAGTLDLLAAIALATIYGAAASTGPAYWLPALWVPALLVTHYITVLMLRKSWRG